MEQEFVIIEEKDCIQMLQSATFKVAKTMPKIPHSYTLKETWVSQKDFNSVVMFIRNNGYVKMFYSKPFMYYNIGEYCYWTMGNSLEITKLINRAKI
jgi:hypothetical protein